MHLLSSSPSIHTFHIFVVLSTSVSCSLTFKIQSNEIYHKLHGLWINKKGEQNWVESVIRAFSVIDKLKLWRYIFFYLSNFQSSHASNRSVKPYTSITQMPSWMYPFYHPIGYGRRRQDGNHDSVVEALSIYVCHLFLPHSIHFAFFFGFHLLSSHQCHPFQPILLHRHIWDSCEKSEDRTIRK